MCHLLRDFCTPHVKKKKMPKTTNFDQDKQPWAEIASRSALAKKTQLAPHFIFAGRGLTDRFVVHMLSRAAEYERNSMTERSAVAVPKKNCRRWLSCGHSMWMVMFEYRVRWNKSSAFAGASRMERRAKLVFATIELNDTKRSTRET